MLLVHEKFATSWVPSPEDARAKVSLFTTSTFTKDALEFAGGVNEIDLIDGEQMTELMFEHGLSVVTERVFELKRVDSDFFDEEL